MTPFLRPFRNTAVVVIATAVVLLIAGLAGAILAERDYREQRMGQALAHAHVLAASVTAALAFQDVADAQDAVDALRASPDVVDVGVYTASGQPFVRTATAGVPDTLGAAQRPSYRNGHASAAVAVQQQGAALGWVYVRLASNVGLARWMRYVGVAIIMVLAGFVLFGAAAAQRAMSTANQELERRANALAESNAQLSAEIAERRKAQSALAHAQKMEAIGQLTGGIAHDFNNLLMVVSSGLRLLETRDDEKKRASIVAAMRQAVDRGAGLTKQLLAFSRRQKLAPEVVLVQDRIETLRPLLERSLREDISIKFEFDDAARAVKVDPGQFDLAVLNLAVNARDAMPSGGVLTVRVKPADEGSTAVDVEVIDTGIGMNAEVLSRAFDPFFTTKEVGKGTGLGLSQVYGFALQSGGVCEIESEPDKGAKIRLRLPCTDEPAPPRALRPQAEPIAAGGAILVVEDDDAVAAMVCGMIEDLGYGPERVANAADALARLGKSASFDLVFSDIVMPGGMSGVQLAEEITKRWPELPVLLTTGYGGRGEEEQQGFKVLRKPYDRDELGAALAQFARETPAERNAARA